MLYWMCEQSDTPLTAPQLEHAIRRNFGGWEDEDLDPLKVFRARVRATEPPDLSPYTQEVKQTFVLEQLCCSRKREHFSHNSYIDSLCKPFNFTTLRSPFCFIFTRCWLEDVCLCFCDYKACMQPHTSHTPDED